MSGSCGTLFIHTTSGTGLVSTPGPLCLAPHHNKRPTKHINNVYQLQRRGSHPTSIMWRHQKHRRRVLLLTLPVKGVSQRKHEWCAGSKGHALSWTMRRLLLLPVSAQDEYFTHRCTLSGLLAVHRVGQPMAGGPVGTGTCPSHPIATRDPGRSCGGVGPCYREVVMVVITLPKLRGLGLGTEDKWEGGP